LADDQTTAALRRAIEAIEKKSKPLNPSLGPQSPEVSADPAMARGAAPSNRGPFNQTRLKSKNINRRTATSNDLSEEVGARPEPDKLELAGRLLGELDPAEIEASERSVLRRSALNLLAQREQTAFELKQKLTRRFPEQALLLDGVIERLQEQGLQDDTRMAEAYVRYRVQRGQGPMKIRSEMMQKGLAGDDIDTAFSRQAPDWSVLATAVLQKRFGDVADSAGLDQKERAKRSRFLQQRGFHYEHISAAL
jgi:regulatory protein